MLMSNCQEKQGSDVAPILERLTLAKEKFPPDSEMKGIIEGIITMVMTYLYDQGTWKSELSDYLKKIETQIDYCIKDKNRIAESKTAIINLIEGFGNQLIQIQTEYPPEVVDTKLHEQASDSGPQSTLPEVGQSSTSDQNPIARVECINELSPHLRSCLYSLSIFPEKSELKKRLVIYWWIGLGLVPLGINGGTTLEQCGEFLFSELVGKGVLNPVHTRKHNRVVDRCTIEPEFHKQLVIECQEKRLISSLEEKKGTLCFFKDDNTDAKALLNQNKKYLNFNNIGDNIRDVQAVQLGISCHNADIDVHSGFEVTELLEEMGGKVSYLSLQGIWKIDELPESIGKLEELLILDLRACHNLEKLPQKPRPSFPRRLIGWAIPLPQETWFKKLTHLDVSECYQLDYMPKWVCEICTLEVLKGFVVDRVGKKKQICQLHHLTKLKKLRKLSIIIVNKHLVPEDFGGLEHLNSLFVLTIIWGDSMAHEEIPPISFPKNLEKLDIRCYPKKEAEALLNPLKLLKLKRLYIRGGLLSTIKYSPDWEVEILRLRLLNHLEIEWYELRQLFKKLKYVEYENCPKLKSFPKGRSFCNPMTIDEPFPHGHTDETSNQ